MIKAAEGIIYCKRIFLKLLQPAGKRATPEKTESKGHALAKERGAKSIHDRKRKIPTRKKKAAKKRYSERLLSFKASNAQPTPRKIRKKAIGTITWEILAIELQSSVQPRSMKKTPIIRISLADVRRDRKNCIYKIIT